MNVAAPMCEAVRLTRKDLNVDALSPKNKNWIASQVVSGKWSVKDVLGYFPLLKARRINKWINKYRTGLHVGVSGRPLKINETEAQKVKNQLKKNHIEKQEASTQADYMQMLGVAAKNTANARGRIYADNSTVSDTYSKGFKKDNSLTNRLPQTKTEARIEAAKDIRNSFSYYCTLKAVEEDIDPHLKINYDATAF